MQLLVCAAAAAEFGVHHLGLHRDPTSKLEETKLSQDKNKRPTDNIHKPVLVSENEQVWMQIYQMSRTAERRNICGQWFPARLAVGIHVGCFTRLHG